MERFETMSKENHDAIVISGWTWEAFNVPERIALALAHAGSRVLYCENPASIVRRSARPLTEVNKGIFAFGLEHIGHRLNSVPFLARIQARLLAKQIVTNIRKLDLRSPLFIYPHGSSCLPLCREFKRRGLRLIHICMDYELPLQIEHVQQSDLTLAIPSIAYRKLKEQFGEKVRLLPQFSLLDDAVPKNQFPEPSELSKIPRPRLGYLGNLLGRASVTLLHEVLSKHPEWQFLSFGIKKWLPLPNEHVLPWHSQKDLLAVLDGLDIGFMPYDCADPKNLHCVPLKLFDYFARGMPVVSTPIVCLSEYADLVYIGATANQLEDAISLALLEPAQSPKRAKRRAIAAEHSVHNLSRLLAEC